MHGWKDECYKYLEIGNTTHATKRPNKRPAGWWDNLEHCIEACKECKNTQELHKKFGGCHIAIRKHGWQKECYKYMQVRTREYTSKQLQDIALKYSSYKEFREKSVGAYCSAKNKGILEEICKHMPTRRKTTKYADKPNYDSCKEHALRFDSRSKFQKEDNRYYGWALRHGIIDEICAHMPIRGNQKKRCIYAAEFEDKCAYIGLTYFAERRWADHLRQQNSAVKKHIDTTGLTPKWKQLTDYIDYQEASKQEGIWKEIYENKGWTILNIAKTGSLGCPQGYTLEEVLQEAKKYDTLLAFSKSAPGYYQSAYRNGWLKNIRKICKPIWRGGFTVEELREIFSKYNNIADLRRDRNAAISAAYKLGIMEELTKDYVVKPKKRYHITRFTELQLYDIAKCYKHRSDFRKGAPKAYDSAKRKGILDKVCAHMEKKTRKKKTEMSKEEILTEAKKFNCRSDFLKHASIAAKRAHDLGIYDEVCSHMTDHHWKYTIEEATQISKAFKTRTNLFNGNKAAYHRLKNSGLLEELFPKQPAYNFKWTDEARRKAAQQCKSRKEFQIKFPQALAITRKRNDWETIAPHLSKSRRLWTEDIIAEHCSPYHNMKELKLHDYPCWKHCMNDSNKRRIAEKHFKNEDK